MQSAFLLFVLSVLVAGYYGWATVIGRLWRGEPVLPAEPRRPVPWGLLDLLLTIAIYVAIMFSGVLLLRASGWMPAGEAAEQPTAENLAGMLLVNAIANVVMLPLSWLIIAVRTKADRVDFGWDPRRAIGDLWIGGIAFAMIAPPVYLLQFLLTQWFPSEHPLMKLVTDDPSVTFIAISGFAAVIAAPLAEEYLFRLLLQGWLERAATAGGDLRLILLGGRSERAGECLAENDVATNSPPPITVSRGEADLTTGAAGRDSAADNPYLSPSVDSPAAVDVHEADQTYRVPLWPMFVSAGVFAMMHVGHGPDPIPLFFLALALGFLYQRTHRLLPCLVVHLLLNATSMLALIVSILSQPA